MKLFQNSFVLFYLLLPSIVVLIGLLVRRYWWQNKLVAVLTAPVHRKRLLLNFSLTHKKISVGLLTFALIFLACALGQPTWGIDEQEHEQKSRDMLFILDISRSMRAQDLSPDRITCAQQKIGKLVQAIGADRVGLIVFAGTPVVYCPFTSDHEAFMTLLSTVQIPVKNSTTDIAQALHKACEVFERMPSRRYKIIVLFTDGEDFSEQLASVKEKVRRLGITSITVGVGTSQGAPIPCIDHNGVHTGYERDEHNNVVLSRLNEQLLKNLAQESGAVYCKITQTDHDIQAIQSYCERFEKEYYARMRVAVPQQKYYYCALISLVCLMLEWVL
jgi:Ca-activated chloride channel family protein